jgi:hypothetical protein
LPHANATWPWRLSASASHNFLKPPTEIDKRVADEAVPRDGQE